MAKKPAIKTMKAATPLFATKEPAADEVVEEEAAEVVGEAGEEAVDAPLVGELAVGMAMEAVDPPAGLDPPVTPVPPAALDPEDEVTEPLTPMELNGTGLDVALGPVGLRPAE